MLFWKRIQVSPAMRKIDKEFREFLEQNHRIHGTDRKSSSIAFTDDDDDEIQQQ